MGIRWTGEDLESTRVGKGFLQAEAERQQRRPPAQPGGDRQHEESSEQQQLVRICREYERLGALRGIEMLFAVPNGAHVSSEHRRRLWREGMRLGVPDLILPVARAGWHGLAIEMKSSAGRLTREQVEYLERLRRLGWRAEVCHSAAEAIDVIREYLR